MGKTELLEKIRSLGLKEYGVYSADLAARMEEKQGADAVVAALNNADVDGVLLQLLKNPERVFGGMKIAAEAVGTQKMVLHIPEYAAQMAKGIADAAKEAGVEIETGIVNVRACENSLLCHIVTMAELWDAMSGEKTEGVYVSVNGAELKKVPETTTLKELVGEDVKGIQTGYLLRGSEALDMTVADANIENGVVNAITGADCVVAKVDEHLLACRKQSCGKCVFCREGLLQLEAMQKDITIGKGRLEELDMTREIGEAMTFSTPCSMGQKSALMPLSAVEAFKGEYEEHIKKHKCAANFCKAFQKVYVDPVACTGCTRCMSACAEDAIDGAAGYIHIVFDNGCTKCGQCISACPENAIHLTTGAVPKLPPKMMRVGRFRQR